MAEVTIYHNPRCSKSRQTLALLEEHGVKPRIVLYLESPPSEVALAGLLGKLGMTARAVMRKGEAVYSEKALANEALTEGQLIAAMVADPILIERPIVELGKRAAIGRPPENVLGLLQP
jgi:arsenate reductase